MKAEWLFKHREYGSTRGPNGVSKLLSYWDDKASQKKQLLKSVKFDYKVRGLQPMMPQ